MRHTPAAGHSALPVVDDEDARDAARAGPFVAAGLVVLLPFALFALGAVVVDVVGWLERGAAIAASNVFAAVVLTSLFGLSVLTLPEHDPRAGARSRAAR